MRSAAGVKVATAPEQATVPATAVVPEPVTTKLVAGDASVAQFIVWLNVALSTWLSATPVAPLSGTVERTTGCTAVVKLQV